MNNKMHWKFNGNEKKYINSILKKGLKPEKESFNSLLEKKWSKYHKMKYSISINSCTSALHTALKSVGIKNGDDVLVPALTPIMCGTTINFCGAHPIYIDVDPETFLIDPLDIERKITKKTKAILAVHMYSGICNLKKIKDICKKNKIFLIEDCAESTGAKDENNILVGTKGDISCWSFQSAKHLTSGDGGILSTNNRKLGKKIRQFSNLGFKTLTANSNQIVISKNKRQNPNYQRFTEIGMNYRMNEFTAAIALAQTERLNFFVKLRRTTGLAFSRVLKKNKYLIPQKISKKAYSSYYTYAVKLIPNKSKKLNWVNFRKRFIEYGGDGIYAASKLLQQEPAIMKYRIGRCFTSCEKDCIINCKGTPVAKNLQKHLLLFTTNQSSKDEVEKQIIALNKTIKFFNIG